MSLSCYFGFIFHFHISFAFANVVFTFRTYLFGSVVMHATPCSGRKLSLSGSPIMIMNQCFKIAKWELEEFCSATENNSKHNRQNKTQARLSGAGSSLREEEPRYLGQRGRGSVWSVAASCQHVVEDSVLLQTDTTAKRRTSSHRGPNQAMLLLMLHTYIHRIRHAQTWWHRHSHTPADPQRVFSRLFLLFVFCAW